jgi:hypothetical protein
MFRRITLFLLWLGFILYAFLLAPPDQPDTLDLITKLSTGQWGGINPLVVSLFNLMGIYPLIYSAVLLIDGRGQKIPAWPFVLGSFAVGAFAILPYLALRQANPVFSGEKSGLIKLLDSRWFGLSLLLGALALLVYGFSQGNGADFIAQWQSSRFIHVMSLDFYFLSLVFPLLLKDDMSRRGMKNPSLFWLVSLLPLLGPAWYLCTRPPLPETT